MFENQAIDIPCKKCGYKRSFKISELKGNPKYKCARCGIEITINANDFNRDIQKIENKLQNLFKR